MTALVTSDASGKFVLVEKLERDNSPTTVVIARMKKVGFSSFYLRLVRELLASAGKNANLLAQTIIARVDSGDFKPGSPTAREFVRKMKS
jgi:hypothetical protein